MSQLMLKRKADVISQDTPAFLKTSIHNQFIFRLIFERPRYNSYLLLLGVTNLITLCLTASRARTVTS